MLVVHCLWFLQLRSMGIAEEAAQFYECCQARACRATVEDFITAARRLGLRVESGVFGAHMDVTLCNDGPVTLILDSPSFQTS